MGPISRRRCGYIVVTNASFISGLFQVYFRFRFISGHRLDCSVLPVLVVDGHHGEFKVILQLRGKVVETLARLAVVRGHLFSGGGGLLCPNFLSSGACYSFTFPVHKQQICEFKQVTFSEQPAFSTFYANKAATVSHVSPSQSSACEDSSVFTSRSVTVAGIEWKMVVD